jgi:hypothetical protein
MMMALAFRARLTSDSLMPPTPLAMILTLHFVSGQAGQRIDDGLGRALHIGLEHHVEDIDLTSLELPGNVVQTDQPACGLLLAEPCLGGTGRFRAPCARRRPQ